MSDAQGATTRAITRAGLSKTTDTRILMHIESKQKDQNKWRTTRTLATATKDATYDANSWSSVNFESSNTRYWDDCFGRQAELSVYAVAIPGHASIDSESGDNKLNEDDLAATTSGTNSWTADVTSKPAHTITWGVTTSGQTSVIRESEDLVYSNNIQIGGTKGVYRFGFTSQTAGNWPAQTGSDDGKQDGVMKFSQHSSTPADGPGRFDKGHMKFNHALTRMQITLSEDAGFDGNTGTNTDFQFTSGNAITVHSVTHKATLDLTKNANAADAWSTPTTGNITLSTTASNANTTFYAQFIPGKVLKSTGNTNADNAISFTIDNNTYYITEKDLYYAIEEKVKVTYPYSTTNDPNTEDSIKSKNYRDEIGMNAERTQLTMQAGKNYIFTIKVKKTGIAAVSATLAAWNEVNAEAVNKNNSHYTFSNFYSTGSNESLANHHLFRKGETLSDIYTGNDGPSGNNDYTAENYQGAYSVEAILAQVGTSNVWKTTNWYFEDNKTAYHFRVINDKAYTKTSSGDNYSSTANSYFCIENGSTASTDYHWGAPFDNAKITNNQYPYSTSYGYKGLLHKGIMATESEIKLTELHMMSNIKVVLQTTQDDSAVKLVDGGNKTQVYITKIFTKAKVDMGIGLVYGQESRNGETVSDGQEMTMPTISATANSGLESGTETINSATVDIYKTPEYTYSVVPQSLKFTESSVDKFVGIIIETPDANRYYVVQKLSEIAPKSTSNNNNYTSGAIEYWYPNHTYTYTFTLTKKGIESMTCTLADWVEVKGENTNIDLEN